MKLLKTPLWNLEGGEPVDVDHHVVRIKLYKDEVVAEFTISELCSFFGLKDLHCLRLQFEVWHELASFEWDSEECVHLEQKPFTDYFHASKISGLRVKMCVWCRRVAGLDVAFLDAD